MKQRREPFWERVEKARTYIKTVECDDPRAIDNLLCARSLKSISSDLDRCPIGDGHGYRDIAAELLAAVFGEILDLPLSRKEAPSHGGRFDVEFPVRIESLTAQSLWDRWATQYRIKSVLVETKNEKKTGIVRDVQQLLSYLVTGRKGKFGILVCRNGFTRCAQTLLSEIAASDEFLILPFDHLDLKKIAGITGRATVSQQSEFLRRKQTLLLQSGR